MVKVGNVVFERGCGFCRWSKLAYQNVLLETPKLWHDEPCTTTNYGNALRLFAPIPPVIEVPIHIH